jgi:hypothetical protein
LKIYLQICENLKRFLKCSTKMSYFGLKSKIFFEKLWVGNHILFAKGLKKSLEGRTLAMPGLDYFNFKTSIFDWINFYSYCICKICFFISNLLIIL